MNKKTLFLAAALLSVFALLIAFFVSGLGKDPKELPSVLTGRTLPTIDRPSLDGKTHFTNRDLPPKTPFLINIWGTWCPACVLEHPYLLQLGQRLPIIGVNWAGDNPHEASDAQQFLRQHGNPYQFILSDPDGSLITDLGVYGAPETFLINAAGKIVLRHAGVMTPEVWAEKFQPLLPASNHEK